MKTKSTVYRRFVVASLAAVSLGAGAFGATPAQAAPCANENLQLQSAPANPAADTRAAVRTAVVCLINQQRTSMKPFSVVPLKVNAALSNGAQQVAETINPYGTFSWAGINNHRSAYCKGTSCSFTYFGDYMDYATPRKIVDQWMTTNVKSDLLSPQNRDIGIGAMDHYWYGDIQSHRDGFVVLLGRTG